MRRKSWRGKGSSFVASTDRKTSLLRDRPARRAVKRAYRIWVSDAAHHCVQLRIDLLFTMSDNLHRVIEDRRDTNSSSWTSCWQHGCRRFARAKRSACGSHHSIDRTPLKLGGARRDRTDDLLLAKQALSQLSYGPGYERRALKMVGLGRLELPTSRLSSARSNQLSYKPNDRPHSSQMDARGTGSSMKEREMKTAVSCQWT